MFHSFQFVRRRGQFARQTPPFCFSLVFGCTPAEPNLNAMICYRCNISKEVVKLSDEVTAPFNTIAASFPAISSVFLFTILTYVRGFMISVFAFLGHVLNVTLLVAFTAVSSIHN